MKNKATKPFPKKEPTPQKKIPLTLEQALDSIWNDPATSEAFSDQLLHSYFKWIDTILVRFVKDHFAPRPTWVGKPFQREDAMFFMTSLRDLSRTFTTARDRSLPRYFEQAKYRSSYFLFFLPLHASKFLSLLLTGKEPIQTLLQKWLRGEKIRIGDFGAGPATATLAFHFFLNHVEHVVRSKTDEKFPVGEIEWCLYDLDSTIMNDGLKLIEKSFKDSTLFKRSKYTILRTNWVDAVRSSGEFDLSFFGNVLNEAPEFRERMESALLDNFPKHARILFVEPATAENSSRIVQLRQHYLEQYPEDVRIFGPCLHQETCPLSRGRDWCHFSIPLEIDSKWFRFFTQGLHQTQFEWVKMSYLWIGHKSLADKKIIQQAKKYALVVSDPIKNLRGPGSQNQFVLICQPEEVARLPVKFHQKLRRGDLISKDKIR